MTAATAYGTVVSVDPNTYDYIFDPDSPGNYFIEGRALCNNPANKRPRNFPGGTAVPYYYPGGATSGNQVFDCTKNGNCKELLTLNFELGQPCKDKWFLVDFTAQEFIGVQDFCPGGYADGVCCATDERTNGSCAARNPGLVNDGLTSVDGGPTRYVKACYYDLTNYQFGDSFTYCCRYCALNGDGTYNCTTAMEQAMAGQCTE
jgi:hypothetical protein